MFRLDVVIWKMVEPIRNDFDMRLVYDEDRASRRLHILDVDRVRHGFEHLIGLPLQAQRDISEFFGNTHDRCPVPWLIGIVSKKQNTAHFTLPHSSKAKANASAFDFEILEKILIKVSTGDEPTVDLGKRMPTDFCARGDIDLKADG